MDLKSKEVYYADGYHGGVKGHMPFGCWPDILYVFRRKKEWKISIEVEPISWDEIKHIDPMTYEHLQKELFAKKNQDRVEIVSGSYAQPYCWTIGGESNIRQLIYGIRLNKAHFPDVTIDTYAVQEPCWTSSLPQILRSLGFKRSTLKNPATAWGGYSRGFDAGIVNWVGPDGTSIPCVPRYACEELSPGTWATECERMEEDFVQKCNENGITKPIGSQYQDLGWSAGLNLGMGYATYVIWREYFEAIVNNPIIDWRFSQEDILCALPWGEKHLQRLARQVRSAENKIITAEKIASMAYIVSGLSYPMEKFQASWHQLMLAQHHDAWICTTTREERDNWGWLGGAQTWVTEENCEDIIRQSFFSMKGNQYNESAPNNYVMVYNTLGFVREEVIRIEIPMKDQCNDLVLRDSLNQSVPFQLSVMRVGDDGAINAVSVLFKARVPAMGFATYSIEYIQQEKPIVLEKSTPNEKISTEDKNDPIQLQGAVFAVLNEECLLSLHTDVYDMTVDLNRGGAITRLYHKTMGKDFCKIDGQYHVNEYRGYFASLGKEMSSADFKATAEIIENGPFRLVVKINGRITDNQLNTTITLVKGQERIDLHTKAIFSGEQWIGSPCEIADENLEPERVRSHYDSFKNLHAVFPFDLEDIQVYKNAAYDVCKSTLKNTQYSSWDQIKHNIVLNWVDLYDEKAKKGVCIMSDHTTSYGHAPDSPFHLTFAWSGQAGFWWGKCPLTGLQEMRYAILPHQGNWEQSLLSQKSVSWNEPLLHALSLYPTEIPSVSLFETSDSRVEIAAVYVEEQKVFVRLYHAGTTSCQFTMKVGFHAGKIEMLELDGRLISVLQPQTNACGVEELSLTMQPFGIRTLSFSLLAQ